MELGSNYRVDLVASDLTHPSEECTHDSNALGIGRRLVRQSHLVLVSLLDGVARDAGHGRGQDAVSLSGTAQAMFEVLLQLHVRIVAHLGLMR